MNVAWFNGEDVWVVWDGGEGRDVEVGKETDDFDFMDGGRLDVVIIIITYGVDCYSFIVIVFCFKELEL